LRLAHRSASPGMKALLPRFNLFSHVCCVSHIYQISHIQHPVVFLVCTELEKQKILAGFEEN
jgi:hypothetical protein